jgi:hypothetical protein
MNVKERLSNTLANTVGSDPVKVSRDTLVAVVAELERLTDDNWTLKQLQKGMVDAIDVQAAEREADRLRAKCERLHKISAIAVERAVQLRGEVDRLQSEIAALALERIRRSIPVDAPRENP